MKSSKGSAFERSFCAKLSLWFSEGENDSLCWRTAGSGARATVRGRKGKKTTNHCGDISPTHQSIQPFFDHYVLELKRGYSKFSLQDILDAGDGAATQLYEHWIDQARESAKNAGSVTWMIVFKRDRREPMVIVEKFPSMLDEVNFDRFIKIYTGDYKAYMIPLKDWFEIIPPKMFKEK